MKNRVVADKETIYDIAAKEYGSIEAVFQLQQDNPTIITSLDVDLLAGQILKIDETKSFISDFNKPASVVIGNKKAIIVAENQTIYDIAIQEYGNLEGLFRLQKDNPDVITSLNVVLKPGQSLNITSDVIDKNVTDHYKAKNLHPVSPKEEIGGDYNNDYNNDFSKNN